MIGTMRTGRHTAGIGRRCARGGAAALGIALVLAAAGCDGSGSEPTHAAPSATAPSVTAPAPAGATPAATPPAGATPAATPPAGAATTSPSSAQCPGTAGESLRLLGHRIEHDLVYLSAEDGRWDCSDASAPRWRSTGKKHDIRIAESARVAVTRPFTSSATNQPIELSRFLERIDTLAGRSSDPLVFSYATDPASGLLVRLDQEQAPRPTA